ncbi:MAG: hypothetical protein WA948_03845 [Pontixanthobacter sp.]
MSFASIDHWIGRTLFVPPIVKLCQITRQSQFAVSRMFWFFAALSGFYHASSWFGSILWGCISLFMMFTATQRADDPTRSMMWFRLLAVAALLLDGAACLTAGDWAGFEFWCFVVVAEYASTIVTIPPIGKAQRASKLGVADDRG